MHLTSNDGLFVPAPFPFWLRTNISVLGRDPEESFVQSYSPHARLFVYLPSNFTRLEAMFLGAQILPALSDNFVVQYS